MVHFVGAGCGAEDLITVRGLNYLKKADIIIYAGSLVNPALLNNAKEGAKIYNSATMTLEEIIDVMKKGNDDGRDIVRLHTGEPSLYGAVREQMDELDRLGIKYDSCPGVSACFGAASSLDLEYTLPGISQSLIITRIEGKTSVPDREKLERLASHQASMAIYLSASYTKEVADALIKGGFSEDTPAAIVYKATWPDEKKIICTLGTLDKKAKENDISKIAVILVGDVIAKNGYEKSRLYDAAFSTEYREASK